MPQEGGLRVGQLVRSKAGRDAGGYFLVVGVKDRQTVAIADGRLRRISRPKLKNVKHLEALPCRVPQAEVWFAPDRLVTDRAVADMIRELLDHLAREERPAGRSTGPGPGDLADGKGEPEEDGRGYGQEGRDRGRG